MPSPMPPGPELERRLVGHQRGDQCPDPEIDLVGGSRRLGRVGPAGGRGSVGDDVAVDRRAPEVDALLVDLDHDALGDAGQNVAPPDGAAEGETRTAPDDGDHTDLRRVGRPASVPRPTSEPEAE